MKVAPSILSCDFGRLAEEVQAAEAGGADWIHVDVMDGRFVPNLTIGPLIVAAVRRATDLPLDVHLMIVEPERHLEAFVRAGADVLSVHVEVSPHLHRTVACIRELGARPGVALNPATPVAAVQPIVSEAELILVMSVNPGFGGQAFIPDSVERVREVRRLLDTHASTAELEVDGGVDASNAGALTQAGASVLVAGSAVYGHPDGPAAGMRAIREGVEKA